MIIYLFIYAFYIKEQVVLAGFGLSYGIHWHVITLELLAISHYQYILFIFFIYNNKINKFYIINIFPDCLNVNKNKFIFYIYLAINR